LRGPQVEEKMATASQIKALLQSHVRGDDERFITIAMQVAAHEARQGHTKLANELKQLVDEARAKSRRELKNVVSIIQPKSELASILEVSQPRTKLSDLTFSDEQRRVFERIILEYRQQGKLRDHSLEPRRKLLLFGPPGTGKTATAAALAHELHLPLFTIRLDGLITKFMGETASKLRLVFEAMQKTRGLYLFDEFDAIGSDRHSPNDVGEIRRVLNSFLQFLEQDRSDSMIVAATNYKKLLDSALFRRFDDVINYALPTRAQLKSIIKNKLAQFDCTVKDWQTLEEIAEGLSHAEITRACDDAAKLAVLQGTRTIDVRTIEGTLRERKQSHAA
jgi:SpoVK/Ycf46/Vps4 family AAA+-type ATPase